MLETDVPEKYYCSPEFTEQLRSVIGNDLSKLHGYGLIDYRGGQSLHSWELGRKGKCTPSEIKFMNLLIQNRRKSLQRCGKLPKRRPHGRKGDGFLFAVPVFVRDVLNAQNIYFLVFQLHSGSPLYRRPVFVVMLIQPHIAVKQRCRAGCSAREGVYPAHTPITSGTPAEVTMHMKMPQAKE